MRLIVGIDPGATAGIACIDANSSTKHAETTSRRNFSYSETIHWLSQKGEPLVVATDKARPPLVVRKIAAAFGARLWHPHQDMRQADKEKITEGCKANDDHERDALAAAISAKSCFLETLKKVERNVEKEKQGAVKKLLLTGQAANIETALEMLETRRTQRIGKERVKDRDVFVAGIKKELEDTRKRNAALEAEITELRKQLEMKKYSRSESSAIWKLRESGAKLLAEKNRETREIEKIVEGEYIVAAVYSDTLDGEQMKNKAIILDSKDDMAVKRIENAGAVAIITDGEITTILPAVKKRKADIKQAGRFLVIARQDIEKEERRDFAEWLHDYKEKRKKAAES